MIGRAVAPSGYDRRSSIKSLTCEDNNLRCAKTDILQRERCHEHGRQDKETGDFPVFER